jgi:hypothetical protein
VPDRLFRSSHLKVPLPISSDRIFGGCIGQCRVIWSSRTVVVFRPCNSVDLVASITIAIMVAAILQYCSRCSKTLLIAAFVSESFSPSAQDGIVIRTIDGAIHPMANNSLQTRFLGGTMVTSEKRRACKTILWRAQNNVLVSAV